MLSDHESVETYKSYLNQSYSLVKRILRLQETTNSDKQTTFTVKRENTGIVWYKVQFTSIHVNYVDRAVHQIIYTMYIHVLDVKLPMSHVLNSEIMLNVQYDTFEANEIMIQLG